MASGSTAATACDRAGVTTVRMRWWNEASSMRCRLAFVAPASDPISGASQPPCTLTSVFGKRCASSGGAPPTRGPNSTCQTLRGCGVPASVIAAGAHQRISSCTTIT